MNNADTISNNNPLGTAPIGKLLVKFAVPTIVSTLAASLYNIVDQIFIGQRIGYLGNAATTVAYPMTIMMGALSLLFSNGSTVNFNVANGAGKKEDALYYAGNCLSLMLIEGTVLALVIGIFTPFFTNLFGATEEVFPYALTYMRTVAIGLPCLAVTSGGTLLIRSDGDPRYALICSLSGVGINYFLDWLFLFPLDMGITGAALATILGQIISMILVVIYMKRFRTGKLHIYHFRVNAERFFQIISIGAAASLNQLAMFLMNLILNSSLRYYGALSIYGASEALAAAGVVTKINFLFYSTVVGCGIGGSPIIGYNYGAGKYERIKDAYVRILSFSFVIGIIETICFRYFPGNILSMFGGADGGYKDFALLYMQIFMMLVILAGIPPVSMNLMSSIKKPVKGVVISLSKQLILILALLILPRLYGIYGVLYAGPAADLIASVGSFVVVRQEFRLLNEQVHSQ